MVFFSFLDFYFILFFSIVTSPLRTASILLSPPARFVVRSAGLVALADSTGYIHTVPLCGSWNGKVSIENSWCTLTPNDRHLGKSCIESLAGNGDLHLSVAHPEVHPGLAMSLIFPFPNSVDHLIYGAGAEINDSAHRA